METTLGIYGTMPSLVPIGTLCMETSPDCSTELKRSSSFGTARLKKFKFKKVHLECL